MMSRKPPHTWDLASQMTPEAKRWPWRFTLFVALLVGMCLRVSLGRLRFGSGASAAIVSEQRSSMYGRRSLDDLLRLPEREFEKLDIVELNLAVAREIPSCRGLDAGRYVKMVDEWAAWIKHEVDRHWYQFETKPAEYNHSKAYFCALMMRTILDQDFGIRYDVEGFSFEEPEDLFIHGVIDDRRGTCLSLPILQIAIGQRLGWPIKAVAVPGHTFCRWDDPANGERLNIEAANTRGFVDHDDEYYRHWPFEVDPRWEREHHVLASLTMRQHAAVMVGGLGGYFEARGDRPAAIRWDALAHWLDPADRGAFVSLRLGMEHSLPRYFDADELAGRKKYYDLTPNPSLLANPTYRFGSGKEAAKATSAELPAGGNNHKLVNSGG